MNKFILSLDPRGSGLYYEHVHKRNGNAHHRRRKNRNPRSHSRHRPAVVSRQDFDQATIRDIACEANLAVGTLFNYFPSKEAVAIALAEVAIAKARQEAAKKRPGSATLEEELFLHIAARLRALKPLRKFIQPVVDSALSAPVHNGASGVAAPIWADQHNALADVFGRHAVDSQRWSMTVPVFWALLVGVLSFWSRDKSPRQEDSLAMVDQATPMFVAWLQADK